MRVQDYSNVFTAWASYTVNTSKTAKSFSALSSGLKDTTQDPAGVGISARMLSAFSSNFMAVQNVDTSISAVQTADSWSGQINSSLSRMKDLSIQYNSGTLSDADKISLEVEFDYLQRDITRISSTSAAAAKFNGETLLQGGSYNVQAGDSTDQTISIQKQNLANTNTSQIGEVVTYDDTGAATKTPVTWSEIIDSENGLKISDSLAVGKLDVAIDYVSKGRAQNASEIERLETAKDGLMDYQANLNEAASKIGGVDIALASSQSAVSQILSYTDIFVMAQGEALDSSMLASLFQM